MQYAKPNWRTKPCSGGNHKSADRMQMRQQFDAHSTYDAELTAPAWSAAGTSRPARCVIHGPVVLAAYGPVDHEHCRIRGNAHGQPARVQPSPSWFAVANLRWIARR